MGLTTVEMNAIRDLYYKINSEFKVKKFILFGSKARNSEHTDSDIDLLILTERPKTFSDILNEGYFCCF